MPGLAGRLPVAALIVALGGVGIYLAASADARAGVGAAIAVACAVALLLRAQPASHEAVSLGQVFDALVLVAPGVLIVSFAFSAGGYFPAAPAVAAILLGLALVLRVTLVDEPFAGVSRPLAIAAAALGSFAVWTLLSGSWSHAPGRSLLEFDRTFVYLLLLVLCGCSARNANRLRWMAGAVAVATLVVAVAALATRLFPDRFPISIPAIGESNLAYPLTYSNALGILCVLGAILALYFASSTRLPRGVRALGAAALPIHATTVYLTLSRGPVAAAIVGVVAFVVLGRSRGVISALAATLPTSVIAVASAYHHELLTSNHPQSAAAAAQGHTVAAVLVLCVVSAAVIRMLLTTVDDRLARFSLPPARRRPVLAGAWAAFVVAVVAFAVAVDAPAKISDQYDRFVASGQASPTTDIRQSIFSTANRGLVDNWTVALDAFKDAPLAGQGAGTYETWWYANRPARQAGYPVTDAHSLYLETLAELGLVGFVLLAVALVAILFALAPFGRGGNRTLYAALFSVVLAWAVHAGIDWDWEMPAVTAGVFALGGAALAAHERDIGLGWVSQAARVSIGVLLLVGAVAPVLVLNSQRQLSAARDALRAGDCTRAVDRAAASVSTLSNRPEPYEILGLCQAKRGRPGLAVPAFRKATKNDPDYWRYHYELATVQGASGIDPRGELQRAHKLDPTNATVNDLIKSIPPGETASWDVDLAAPGGATGAALGK
jgi:hypothetical protein